MNLSTAISLIKPVIQPLEGLWADVGAGTGMFTIALQNILEGGTIYALDKNPHALWRLEQVPKVKLVIEEADFTRTFDHLPEFDGMVMANALHYSPHHLETLQLILRKLKKGGTFILIEYQQSEPMPPWVPYPITFEQFKAIANDCDLTDPVEIGRVPSQYGHRYIYSASCQKN